MNYKTKLNHLHESCVLIRTPEDAQGFLSSKIAENFPDSDLVFIAENDAEMELIQKQINFFAPQFEILNFYAWDCLPYDRASPKPAISANRIKTLYRLSSRAEGQKFFIITSVNSLLQKTVAPAQIKGLGLYLKIGSKVSLEQISEFLINKGYRREACANGAAEFAVRGGIIDLVMQQAADLIGYRIDFFGDEIESIKIFDPITQISQEAVKALEILPASEVIISKNTVENFRKNYRENFGAALDDQLYSAISEMRSYPGMEHWLPFFYEEKLVNFLEYLQKPVIFFDEKIFPLAEKRCEIINEYYSARTSEARIGNGSAYHAISPDLLYFSDAELKNALTQKITIQFNKFDCAEKNQRILDLEIRPVPDFALAGRANQRDPVELMKEFVGLDTPHPNHLPQGERGENSLNGYFRQSHTGSQPPLPLRERVGVRGTTIACLSETFRDRIAKILPDYGLKLPTCVLPLHFGFYTSDFILIGEQALFGEKIIRKKSSKAAAQRLIDEGLSINLGELVVHRDHGIGKFDGIHTISAGGIKTDMIKILYGGNDTLFVPVDDINLITRYGADNPLIQLDRLGVAAWKNRREKVRKRIKVAAEELLKIAAARHLKKAPIFVPEQHFYEEFKARFSFVETEDQLKAIDEVEEDLRRGSPMDRLICGDVGFGKTEVAMRAAAVVVGAFSLVDKVDSLALKNIDPSPLKNIDPSPLKNIDPSPQPSPARGEGAGSELGLTPSPLAGEGWGEGYQVSIVTPTTLLARQHYKNFSKRFEGTNIKVVQLSRLIGVAEAKKIRQEIESGAAQIIIGTHALLQKTIKFKNLSLVIIDEEQHFGVAQKERLKELRNEVHVLTLSATPIPRTLQMSLTGVKDLSLIATPPMDRLAVRNFVMPYDSVIVREAVMREYNRGGRVFFVVPRIRDIEEMEPRLKILLPEIKITHAHGQMSPTQLDKIMNDFVDGKIDMLLSTTIIESGIDIAEANTIIIYKAEMFGLAQLYQLRGRVGRGKVRAYSYFMLDNRKKISDDSRKKLEVMQNLDSLGVGFTIASHDMDIRGSGNLLGDEQSGHVKETGVELYQQLLLETIEELKHGTAQNAGQETLSELETAVQIKLGISLLIPEEYMSDLGLRMSFYKKIAAIKSDEEQEKLVSEMEDRFGKIPTEILNLMEIARLKFQCKKLGVERLEAVSEGIVIGFKDNKFAAPEKLLEMVFASKGKVKLHTGQKILFVCDVKSAPIKIASAQAALGKLGGLV